MPKQLVEIDSDDAFVDPVTVPEGDDDMDDAANVVEAIAQSAADRTRYLYNRTAKRATGNTFTGDNTFNGAAVFEGITEVRTTLVSKPDAADAPGIHFDRTSGHDYQALITARAGTASNARVRIYSGVNGDTQGALYFVTNAEYEVGVLPAPSQWRQVDVSKPSTALIMRNGDVRVVSKPAGVVPATWSSWQQNDVSNIAGFDSELLAEVMRCARSLTTGPRWDAYENVGHLYATPVNRTSPIPLGRCWGNIAYRNGGRIVRRPYSYAGPTINDDCWIPIGVPQFNTFGIVRVRFVQYQNSAYDNFLLYRRTHDGEWTEVSPGTIETHNAASVADAPVVATLHTGPVQRVLEGEEYAYLWRRNTVNSISELNQLVGASVEWTDYGPVNRVG